MSAVASGSLSADKIVSQYLIVCVPYYYVDYLLYYTKEVNDF